MNLSSIRDLSLTLRSQKTTRFGLTLRKGVNRDWLCKSSYILKYYERETAQHHFDMSHYGSLLRSSFATKAVPPRIVNDPPQHDACNGNILTSSSSPPPQSLKIKLLIHKGIRHRPRSGGIWSFCWINCHGTTKIMHSDMVDGTSNGDFRTTAGHYHCA